MLDPFMRTKLLIGNENFEKLKASRVAVFGVGGVGSYVIEGLARAGIGNLDIFDGDTVNETNINRQIIADFTTIGLSKVEVMKKRLLNINPKINVNANECVFKESSLSEYSFKDYDYIVDAIDMVSSKILIIVEAKKLGKRVISCMGTGNKICPEKLKVSDIYSTKICPLARIIRRELKVRQVKDLKVVYSEEKPIYVPHDKINASISFVPPFAGFLIASEVVRDLINTR